jgi:hypothetical protein
MTWTGVNESDAALEALLRRADTAVREIVEKSSLLLVAAAQKNFSGSHRRGQPHVGGAAPNIVTGELRRSITADPVRKRGQADYATTVAPRMIYGRRVELGFQGSQGYPYFTPAVDTVIPQLEKLGARIWREHVHL